MTEDMTGNTKKNRYRLDIKVYEIKRVIDRGTTNATLRQGLIPYGYDHKNLERATQLADRCTQAIRGRKYALNEQKGLTEQYKQARAKTHDSYMDLVKIARVVFKKDRQALMELQLKGRRKITWLGWREQVRSLYEKLLGNTDYLAAITRFSYPESRLRAELTAAEEGFAIYAVRENARARAQKATLDRNLLLDELLEWFSDYLVFVRIVLKEIPELLIGIVRGHDGKIFVPNKIIGEPGTFIDPPPAGS
jgi:hypothetical protein